MKEKSQKISGRENKSDYKKGKHGSALKDKSYRKVESERCKSSSNSDDSRYKSDDKHKSSRGSKRNNKKQNEGTKEESYEELSRKKRKIEQELQALDLEEAAAAKKQKQGRKPSKPRNTRIKEEKVSDEEIAVPERRRSPPEMPQNNKFGIHIKEEKKPEKDKEKPDFAVSGKLAEDTNVYNGVVIKYNEPGEARKPKRRWRLYPFKGDSDLPFIPIHRQSAYLLGRTRAIADIPIDHPSCSKQHAVLQFRLVPYKRDDGSTGRRVRPYIIDLESSNGTFVNNKRIDPRCYVELMEKDVIKFGYSSREYVLLHEESKNDDYDDAYYSD